MLYFKCLSSHSRFIKLVVLSVCLLILSGCASVKNFFAVDSKPPQQGPIANPFLDFSPQDRKQDNIVLRTKKGDRSFEVELPGGHSELSDFAIPVNPNFKEGRNPSSYDPENDQSFRDRTPSMTDREITNKFSQGSPEHDATRHSVESELGLMPSEDSAPAADRSYLAAMDHVKSLYKSGRYEVGLLELDELLRAYPTDSRLYEMRGTLLDRLGKQDLALKSWNQAVRLDPSNQPLKKFVERKSKNRSPASP